MPLTHQLLLFATRGAVEPAESNMGSDDNACHSKLVLGVFKTPADQNHPNTQQQFSAAQYLLETPEVRDQRPDCSLDTREAEGAQTMAGSSRGI